MDIKSKWFLKVPDRKTNTAMIVGGIAVGLIAAWLSYYYDKKELTPSITLFIITETLVAGVFYVYYTYRIALVNWIPVGSFVMTHHPEMRHLIVTFPKNHSKLQNIEMWVKLNPKVNGRSVEIKGFYGGEHGWFIQPSSDPRGVFDIYANVLGPAGQSIESMKAAVRTNQGVRKTQLRFTVKIRFRGVESNIEREYPEHDYYYDFISDSLIPDV
jgi:hypothetical protein